MAGDSADGSEAKRFSIAAVQPLRIASRRGPSLGAQAPASPKRPKRRAGEASITAKPIALASVCATADFMSHLILAEDGERAMNRQDVEKLVRSSYETRRANDV